MIITLEGADFSSSKIGTLNSWTIVTTLGNGATYSGPYSVLKENTGFAATITIADGWEVNTNAVTVTMDGKTIIPTFDKNIIKINITPQVTGNIYINVPTTAVGAITYTITYQINGHGTQPNAVSGVTALPSTLPTLSASGWTFGGWYTDSACTKNAIAGTAITANTTLYAKWTEAPAVDPETCEHTFGTGNICTKCSMPNYSLVTIIPDDGVESVTVTKIAGWGEVGQEIASGTQVHIGDKLRVVVVPKSGYVVVGESDYTTVAYSGGCSIVISTMVYEDVAYEVIDPATYDTHLDYYVTTNGKATGPYTTWKYDVIPVTAGRKYHIKTVAGQAARMWLMLNGPDPLISGTILRYSQDSSAVALKEEYVVAPAGATYMCVNTRKDKPEYPIIEVHPTYQE